MGDRRENGDERVVGGQVDAGVVRAWVHGALGGLRAARERIDAVNVFPVADSDTGTNVLLTVTGGVDLADQEPADATAGAVASAFARGAMLAARGNSGIIVSQYLAGLARRLDDGAAPADVAAALVHAARAARQSMTDPQEGTVLTVADVVAQAATTAADAGADVASLLAQVVDDAHRSLATVSATHPVLRRAHVLDAGACALLVVLGALARAAAGEQDAAPDVDWLPVTAASAGGTETLVGGSFEVMALVRGGSQDLGSALRQGLAGVGDSVAVVGADGWWHVHVHTDDPAAAIGVCAPGRREQVVVRALESPHGQGAAAADDGGWGLVVCTAAPALSPWFAAAGAVAVVACPEAPVTAEHVLRAITDTGSPRTVLVDGAGLDERELAAVRAARGDSVTVLPAGDDVRAAVATLAVVGSVAGRPDDAGAAALARVRAVELEDVAGLPARAAELAGDGESVTVLHRDPLGDDDRREIERLAGGLEVTFVGPAGRGPALTVARD